MSSAAGLALNWKKTVFVNFSRFSHFEVRRMVERSIPFAAAAKISSCARYLGFNNGPEALSTAWASSCSKILARSRHIRSLGLSLVEVVVAFNVFVFSLLRFLLQLVPLDTMIMGEFTLALDVATGTPRFSLGLEVLSGLRRLGFFTDIANICQSHCISHCKTVGYLHSAVWNA